MLNGLAVSIHAPTRGATRNEQLEDYARQFQSTLPHGERPCYETIQKQEIAFQSTLPHGERLRTILGTTKMFVSIHAPTRGATVYYILLYITTGCNTVFAKELNAVTNP